MINWFKKKKKEEAEKPESVAEIKTFNKKVDLLFLDNELVYLNNQLLEKARISVTNPVPLISEDKNIGAATVYLENNVVVADIFMVYDCPERLDIENGVKYYPYIHGYYETIDAHNNKLKVVKVLIKSVYLTKEPSKDKRISHV